ncbi:MAG: DUF2169 domain-containing protein [Polyangiaceae bacterium]
MRVIKPHYLTPMPAVFDDGRRLHCVVTVIFSASFDGVLQEERLLWAFATEAVEGMVVDEAMPKPHAEWLVHGSCFAHGEGVRQSFVKAKVAEQEKLLAVFGKRVFKMGVPSTPEPFESVPIRFTHAFGGEGYAENPAGKGYGGSELPQVEVRSPLIKSPDDRPPIASFGRIDVQLPQRMKKTGTYDTRWFKTRYPGIAEDFDPTYFQLAPPDQWLKTFFHGDERFSVVNMHPEKAQLDGAMPNVIARCFVKKRGEDHVDVPLRIDTLHLFPALERQVIVCRGTTPTKSDMLDDIEEIGCGLEWIGRPKSRDHYMATFDLRRSKTAEGGLASLDDTALLPEAAPKPKERLVPPGEGLKQRQMERRLDLEYEKAKQALIDQKVDLKHLPPKPQIDTSVDPDKVKGPSDPPTMEGVQKQVAAKRAEAIAKLRAEVDKMCENLSPKEATALKARTEPALAKAESELVGPPRFRRENIRAELEDKVKLFKNAGMDAAPLQAQLDDPKQDQRLREFEAMQRDRYRKTVQHQGAPPTLSPEASESLRTKVNIHVTANEPFEGMDLTGADLSGLDLRGANLRGAWLEAADLTGAQLAGADLSQAVVARAKLHGADLKGCKARGATFSEADLSQADLSNLDLTDTFFVRANLTDAKLANTNIERADFTEAKLVRTDLSGCTLKNGFLVNLRFEGVSLRDADWDKTTLYQCDFIEVDAQRAKMNLVLLVDSLLDRVRFDDANLVKLQAAKIDKRHRFVGCSFVGAKVHLGMFRGAEFEACTFDHSDLETTDFSGAVADGCTFEDARAIGARFVGASVRGCKFDRADLMESCFGSALLDGASFEGANLFRADFGRSVGADVSMKGANVKRVRTVPKREETA